MEGWLSFRSSLLAPLLFGSSGNIRFAGCAIVSLRIDRALIFWPDYCDFHCLDALFLLTCARPLFQTIAFGGLIYGVLYSVWSSNRRWFHRVSGTLGGCRGTAGHVYGWRNDRQRGWDAGLRDDNPADPIPGYRALQQKPLRAFPRISEHFSA